MRYRGVKVKQKITERQNRLYSRQDKTQIYYRAYPKTNFVLQLVKFHNYFPESETRLIIGIWNSDEQFKFWDELVI
jgi:hypothetical protein